MKTSMRNSKDVAQSVDVILQSLKYGSRLTMIIEPDSSGVFSVFYAIKELSAATVASRQRSLRQRTTTSRRNTPTG